MPQWDSPEQELRIKLVMRNLSQHKFKLLCEWLGCYVYIPPDNRAIYYPLTRVKQISTASDAYSMYLWLSCIECSLNLYDQHLLCQLILES